MAVAMIVSGPLSLVYSERIVCGMTTPPVPINMIAAAATMPTVRMSVVSALLRFSNLMTSYM